MADGSHFLMVGPDPAGLGGISRVVQLWQKAGVMADFGITYLSTSSDHDQWRFQSPAVASLEFARRVRRARAVYVHASSNRSFYRKMPFMALAQALGKPVLLHIHPSHFIDFVDGLEGSLRVAAHALIARCKTVIVLSQGMQEKVRQRFPKVDCVVLPNPVDVKGMQVEPKPLRSRNHLLYLGWYIREKGIFELAEAVGELARDFPDIRVHLHGTKDRSALEQFLDERHLRDWVRPGNWLNEDAKLVALHTAAALVLPSYSEGLPNVVLEAMATRTPLVSTSVGGLGELLRDGDNAIIVPPRDVGGLVSGLRRCLEDASARQRMAETAYREVSAAHDLPVVRERFAKLIGGRL